LFEREFEPIPGYINSQNTIKKNCVLVTKDHDSMSNFGNQ